MDWQGFLLGTQHLSQILFFWTVGIVTILTYVRARKTILMPLRTEIFKRQLDDFTGLMNMFVGKTEFDLLREIDVMGISRCNILRMLDDYVESVLHRTIDRASREYSRCHMHVASKEYFLKTMSCEYAGGHYSPPDQGEKRGLDGWKHYVYGDVVLTDTYAEFVRGLRRIAASPLLPSECAKLIEAFVHTAERNIEVLGEVLTECAQLLPDKYPNAKQLESMDCHWIHNTFMSRRPKLEAEAGRIVDYVRRYYSADTLARA